LELSWSIDGRTDSTVCEEVGAVAFAVELYDEGYFVGDLYVPCEDFTTSQDLYVDDYLARSTLVDEDGFAVFRRVVEDFFDITEGEVTRLVMDFPSGAAPVTPPAPDAGAPVPDAGEPATDAGLTSDDLPAAPDAAAPDAGA